MFLLKIINPELSDNIDLFIKNREYIADFSEGKMDDKIQNGDILSINEMSLPTTNWTKTNKFLTFALYLLYFIGQSNICVAATTAIALIGTTMACKSFILFSTYYIVYILCASWLISIFCNRSTKLIFEYLTSDYLNCIPQYNNDVRHINKCFSRLNGHLDSFKSYLSCFADLWVRYPAYTFQYVNRIKGRLMKNDRYGRQQIKTATNELEIILEHCQKVEKNNPMNIKESRTTTILQLSTCLFLLFGSMLTSSIYGNILIFGLSFALLLGTWKQFSQMQFNQDIYKYADKLDDMASKNITYSTHLFSEDEKNNIYYLFISEARAELHQNFVEDPRQQMVYRLG